MATILVDFNSENWGDQDWLRKCLWSEGKRTHEAIFRASIELETNWLELCYEALGLTYGDDVQVELNTINDFFMFDALNFLDECAEECEDEDEEKPSEKILAFYPKED